MWIQLVSNDLVLIMAGKLSYQEAKRCLRKSATSSFLRAGSAMLRLLSRARHSCNGQHGPHREAVESLCSLEADGSTHGPHHLDPRRGHRQGHGTDIQLLPGLGESTHSYEHLCFLEGLDYLYIYLVLQRFKGFANLCPVYYFIAGC